ncbi:alpha/beta hydrolase [Geitlerinema splendidum]|nr:alpha/beta hydrolase [Geitlerinema splendidum]
MFSPSPLDRLPQKVLNLAEMQLAYLEWNAGSEPLLLLHGLADTGAVWLRVAETLGDRYRIIAPDLRGHGDTSKPKSGYQTESIIADLNALMAHLGWENAHVVAHSWSAKVAAMWATQQPQRFRSLTLVDPFFINAMPNWLDLTFPFFYRVLPFLKMMGPFASYQQAEQQARQLKQYRGWSPLQQLVFQTSIEQKPDGTWGSKFVKEARNEIFAEVMKVAGLTQALETPCLLLLPEAGLNRTTWQIQPYQTYLKNLKIQKIPGNHWAFLVEPEAFNQAIADFLRQVPPDGGWQSVKEGD